jgi:undecaprenyl-diphosphatase
MFFWLMNARLHKQIAKVCRYLTKTGDGELYVLLMAWFYWQEGLQSQPLQAIALAFSIERPLYFILKNSFKRNRPAAALTNFHSLITPSDKFSFPSGHTSAAFLMAALLGYFYPEYKQALYCWAGLVGFSRITLGVHFPTDTLVGGAMGILIAQYSLIQTA